MAELRRRFERFCFRNRDKGIPNLMLFITLGTGLVYLFTMFTQNFFLYDWLCFDRELILQGQVWRLISYPLTVFNGNLLLMLISLYCYYSLGRAVENVWGTLRFNLFYFSGILMMDIFCMLFGGSADVSYLNLSLLLSYATMFPDAQFLILYIIPVKAWVLAIVYLVLTLLGVVQLSFPIFLFPYNLFPLVALANYFLFFGKDVVNVIPVSWRVNARRLFRGKTKQQKPKVVPFPKAGSYEATASRPKAPYTHCCTVCGRTDISDPDLEFRYCSRCKGYHCYCIDHINNHPHMG